LQELQDLRYKATLELAKLASAVGTISEYVPPCGGSSSPVEDSGRPPVPADGGGSDRKEIMSVVMEDIYHLMDVIAARNRDGALKDDEDGGGNMSSPVSVMMPSKRRRTHRPSNQTSQDLYQGLLSGSWASSLN